MFIFIATMISECWITRRRHRKMSRTMLMVDRTFFCALAAFAPVVSTNQSYMLGGAVERPRLHPQHQPEYLHTQLPRILRRQNFYDANKQTKNTGFHFIAPATNRPNNILGHLMLAVAVVHVPSFLLSGWAVIWLSSDMPCHSLGGRNDIHTTTGKFITRADKYGTVGWLGGRSFLKQTLSTWPSTVRPSDDRRTIRLF